MEKVIGWAYGIGFVATLLIQWSITYALHTSTASKLFMWIVLDPFTASIWPGYWAAVFVMGGRL